METSNIFEDYSYLINENNYNEINNDMNSISTKTSNDEDNSILTDNNMYLYKCTRLSSCNNFIGKLYMILSIPTYQDYIRWNTSGKSFIVLNVEVFTTNILHIFFRHNNFNSFIRSLNLYGFKRINKTHNRRRRNNNTINIYEFYHPKFIKGNYELIKEINLNIKNKFIKRNKKSKTNPNQSNLNIQKYDDDINTNKILINEDNNTISSLYDNINYDMYSNLNIKEDNNNINKISYENQYNNNENFIDINSFNKIQNYYELNQISQNIKDIQNNLMSSINDIITFTQNLSNIYKDIINNN